MSEQIIAQKEAFTKELQETDANVSSMKGTIEQLLVKGHQLRGAIYALDLAIRSITEAAEREVKKVILTPIEEAVAAVEASVVAHDVTPPALTKEVAKKEKA